MLAILNSQVTWLEGKEVTWEYQSEDVYILRCLWVKKKRRVLEPHASTPVGDVVELQKLRPTWENK